MQMLHWCLSTTLSRYRSCNLCRAELRIKLHSDSHARRSGIPYAWRVLARGAWPLVGPWSGVFSCRPLQATYKPKKIVVVCGLGQSLSWASKSGSWTEEALQRIEIGSTSGPQQLQATWFHVPNMARVIQNLFKDSGLFTCVYMYIYICMNRSVHVHVYVYSYSTIV